MAGCPIFWGGGRGGYIRTANVSPSQRPRGRTFDDRCFFPSRGPVSEAEEMEGVTVEPAGPSTLLRLAEGAAGDDGNLRLLSPFALLATEVRIGKRPTLLKPLISCQGSVIARHQSPPPGPPKRTSKSSASPFLFMYSTKAPSPPPRVVEVAV